MEAGMSLTEETFYAMLASLQDGPFMPQSGGTFIGAVTAANDTTYSTYKLRNAAIVSSTPTSMANGTVAFIYS
jgi:hypothetical protein